MSIKSDTLIQGVVHSTIPPKSYAKCPNCLSVDYRILIEDEDRATIQCNQCKYQFWKTKL